MKLTTFTDASTVAPGHVSINPECVAYVAEATDANSSTVVGLVTGDKLLVKESHDEVIQWLSAD